MASDVAGKTRATNAKKKKKKGKKKKHSSKGKSAKRIISDHPAPPALRSHSSEVAKNLNLKRADYPPDIVKLVMGLRASSYKGGGTCLAHLFETLDLDKSGDLDCNEFKLALRRFVCHACHCVCRVDLER